MDTETFDPTTLEGKTVTYVHKFSGKYIKSCLVYFNDGSLVKVLFNSLDENNTKEFYKLFLTLWDKATTASGYIKISWHKLNDLLIDIGIHPWGGRYGINKK